jgi:hypothetical protein
VQVELDQFTRFLHGQSADKCSRFGRCKATRLANKIQQCLETVSKRNMLGDLVYDDGIVKNAPTKNDETPVNVNTDFRIKNIDSLSAVQMVFDVASVCIYKPFSS